MIENGNLHIEFPDGKMTLYMDKFFPAPKGVIRKLFLKTIALNYRKRMEYTEDILTWLRQSIIDLDMEETMKARANMYGNRMTSISELKEPLEKQEQKVKDLERFYKTLTAKEKKSFKLELKKESNRLKELKTRMKELKADARYQKQEFNRVQAWEKGYKENIELIEKLTAGWE